MSDEDILFKLHIHIERRKKWKKATLPPWEFLLSTIPVLNRNILLHLQKSWIQIQTFNEAFNEFKLFWKKKPNKKPQTNKPKNPNKKYNKMPKPIKQKKPHKKTPRFLASFITTTFSAITIHLKQKYQDIWQIGMKQNTNKKCWLAQEAQTKMQKVIFKQLPWKPFIN